VSRSAPPPSGTPTSDGLIEIHQRLGAEDVRLIYRRADGLVLEGRWEVWATVEGTTRLLSETPTSSMAGMAMATSSWAVSDAQATLDRTAARVSDRAAFDMLPTWPEAKK
jgi:hypothetical protein